MEQKRKMRQKTKSALQLTLDEMGDYLSQFKGSLSVWLFIFVATTIGSGAYLAITDYGKVNVAISFLVAALRAVFCLISIMGPIFLFIFLSIYFRHLRKSVTWMAPAAAAIIVVALTAGIFQSLRQIPIIRSEIDHFIPTDEGW